MSKLRQFQPYLLLMLILPALLMFAPNSEAEEESGWENGVLPENPQISKSENVQKQKSPAAQKRPC